MFKFDHERPPFPRLNIFLDRYDFHAAVALLIMCLVQLVTFDLLILRPVWALVYGTSVGVVSIAYLLLLLHIALRILVGHRGVQLRDVIFFIISYAAIILLFALCYGCIDRLLSEKIGSVFHTADGRPLGITDFVYYSGVVMTTLGFGDIVPSHPITRIMAILQASTGQIMLVLNIGAIISDLGHRKIDKSS